MDAAAQDRELAVAQLSAAIRPYMESLQASSRVAQSLIDGTFDDPNPTEYATEAATIVRDSLHANSQTPSKMMGAAVLAILDLAAAIRDC